MSDLEPTLGAALDAAENAWGRIVDEWSPGYCRAAATPLADQNSAFTEGFVAGRTVTAEQVEAAAGVVAEVTGEPQAGRFERTMARAALTAAGFLIEGDDHAQ